MRSVETDLHIRQNGTVSVESDMCVTDRMELMKIVWTVLVKSDLDIRQNGISEDSMYCISGK